METEEMIWKLAASEMLLMFATVIAWAAVDEEQKMSRYLKVAVVTLTIAFVITAVSAIWAYLPE